MSSPEAQPTLFGRYVLHHLLAEGGMAEIFLAEQRGVQDVSKLVALKRMLPHLCRQPEFVTMFLDEARIASRLSHPNVVQVFDFGEVEGRYFIAMEYLAGENLTSVFRQSFAKGERIPLPVVLQTMIAVCDGLAYAHSYTERDVPLRVVHRDISPSNIVVTYQGGIKVVDFGIARAVDRRQEATQAGILKGKIPYCSPEQIRGGELDHRSDLFSLGVVFHEMLTGKRLFRREGEFATSYAVLNDPIPKPSELMPGLDPRLDAIVLKTLERDRERRYSSAVELRRDVEQLVTWPPIRIDEYMLQLFGAEKVRKRSTIHSRPGSIPTPLRTDQVSFDSLSSLPSVVAEIVEELPVSSTEPGTRTVALTPSQPSRTLPPPPVPEPAPKRPIQPKVVLASAGAALLVLALAGAALVWRPASGEEPPKQPEPERPKALVGSLEVDTLPRGATVEVAGRTQPGVSPLSVGEVPPGQVVVTATLAGHRPTTELVTVEPGVAKSVVLRLLPEQAKLLVDAPERARVLLDGEDRGGQRRFEVGPGEHRVQVQLAGHQGFETTVKLAAGEEQTVTAKLAPQKKQGSGKLDVSCAPWCQVLLDGQDVGRPSPIVGLEVPAGQHRLTLKHPPSGRSHEVVIRVRPGETVRESASFK